jgi:hypothetical protein
MLSTRDMVVAITVTPPPNNSNAKAHVNGSNPNMASATIISAKMEHAQIGTKIMIETPRPMVGG